MDDEQNEKVHSSIEEEKIEMKDKNRQLLESCQFVNFSLSIVSFPRISSIHTHTHTHMRDLSYVQTGALSQAYPIARGISLFGISVVSLVVPIQRSNFPAKIDIARTTRGHVVVAKPSSLFVARTRTIIANSAGFIALDALPSCSTFSSSGLSWIFHGNLAICIIERATFRESPCPRGRNITLEKRGRRHPFVGRNSRGFIRIIRVVEKFRMGCKGWEVEKEKKKKDEGDDEANTLHDVLYVGGLSLVWIDKSIL